ncbi:hypothetical protein BU787_19390 [Salmonella enterica]|uniref:hypothetical protein n=1 Tax=Salmonella enterica TaxID=28901 RepID=UPI00107B2F26|nr:hypothetical protein [Salmonella enterica]EAA5285689.1 hypothetical protein [Salmonella enterica subsp. houtenae]EAW2133852.1 hypothetical protein [Salmonella enterica subsp. enterica]ECC2947641.1 hypothetical protein [Salmonella enterica subsp. enterica serovar Glostrup]EDW6339224.1 hypothetical protein [Salmonella enterica subsp. enterica serovar Hadar]EHB8802017.1 hypothetical protein [Salmonella enterica subsp. enterica serovar Rough O:z4,z23:-]
MRDDFPKTVKLILAERVAWLCSNPDCRKVTVGPHMDPTKRVNLGQACHIEAAAEGGPRYNKNMTKDQRCSPDNGIWLCSIHSREIDVDPDRFPVNLLRKWKLTAEQYALEELGKARDKDHPDFYTENINRHRELFSTVRDMEYFHLYRSLNEQSSILLGFGGFHIVVKDRYIDISFRNNYQSFKSHENFDYINLLYLPVNDLIDFVVCSCEYDETVDSFNLTFDFRPNPSNSMYFSISKDTSNIDLDKDGIFYSGVYTVDNDELKDDIGRRSPPSLESIYLKMIVASYNIYRNILNYKDD